MTDERALELLLETYVRMNSMKSCETGEKSHALWHSTDFIKSQIRVILKRLERKNEITDIVKDLREGSKK